MEFKQLTETDGNGIREMSGLATGIVRDYYDPIIGKAQNDYMLDRFQSVAGITDQLRHGYRYYFVREDGRDIGFLAFYPREDHMYLSKLYLRGEERGKGRAREILDFVAGKAREEGLSAIELNVNKRNPTVRIYEKLGFRIKRAEKNDIGSGFYMDDYVFRLEW
jgi:GNAT superfamily N-acetyltransferase